LDRRDVGRSRRDTVPRSCYLSRAMDALCAMVLARYAANLTGETTYDRCVAVCWPVEDGHQGSQLRGPARRRRVGNFPAAPLLLISFPQPGIPRAASAALSAALSSDAAAGRDAGCIQWCAPNDGGGPFRARPVCPSGYLLWELRSRFGQGFFLWWAGHILSTGATHLAPGSDRARPRICTRSRPARRPSVHAVHGRLAQALLIGARLEVAPQS
jgi:hypothetical protein